MEDLYYDHTLTPEERERFGIESVSVKRDFEGNGIVINVAQNGLLIGEWVMRWKNAYFKEDEPVSESNKTHRYSLSDDYNAEQSVRIADRKRGQEQVRLQTTIASLVELPDVTVDFPVLSHTDTETKAAYQEVIERALSEDPNPVNQQKKIATHQLEMIDKLIKIRGSQVPTLVRDKVDKATTHYAQREIELGGQKQAMDRRKLSFQAESVNRRIAQIALIHLSQQSDSIADNPDNFLHHARQIRTKPSVLTINNAWLHRSEPHSFTDFVTAMNGFESLYVPMLRTMNLLASLKPRDFTHDPETDQPIDSTELIRAFENSLVDVEDLLDVSHIGGDYDLLADNLQNKNFTIQQLLVDRNFKSVIKAARQFRYLLKYRVSENNLPTREWYSGLPGVKTKSDPIPLKQEWIDDPFSGLPGNRVTS